MSYYEKLSISQYIGQNVIVGLRNGTFYEGRLVVDLINEDWKEDGEREALGLEAGKHIEAVYLDTIKFIVPANVAAYA